MLKVLINLAFRASVSSNDGEKADESKQFAHSLSKPGNMKREQTAANNIHCLTGQPFAYYEQGRPN